ncbi:hypothetical protein CPB86DRAFT_846246 [Serendipita vermifera]|nr:hypothetical protein CPB86DRAFT_846246 [Serendipita vermifera]
MDIRHASPNIKNIDKILSFPTFEDIFWERMHASKRYELSQEEYEKEWSTLLKIYLFGDISTINEAFESPLTEDPNQCSICLKVYPRIAGAEGCENRHLGKKPYVCTRKCGNKNWCDITDSYLPVTSDADSDEVARERLQQPRNGRDTIVRQSQRRSAVIHVGSSFQSRTVPTILRSTVEERIPEDSIRESNLNGEI